MRIGIDMSQTAFEQSGVANYLINLVEHLVKEDPKVDYVLFFSSLRKSPPKRLVKLAQSPNVTLKTFRIPPTLLAAMWNKAHKIPIEQFVGDVDVFLTSDWTEPPVRRAKKATILYDLIVYKNPEETDKKIIESQRQKMRWVRKESDAIFCISESTKKDASEILNIDKKKLYVMYPGA